MNCAIYVDRAVADREQQTSWRPDAVLQILLLIENEGNIFGGSRDDTNKRLCEQAVSPVKPDVLPSIIVLYPIG